jgi:hypothetical protein
VTPRDRCARCLPVIRRRCHVICLRVAFCHVIMCISSACFLKLVSVRVSQFSPLSVPSPSTLARARGTSEIFFYKWDKNVLGMGQELTSGLGTSPVDRLSNFIPFGGRLMPQRLAALTVGPLSLCSPAPLHNSPLAHQTPLHALRRRITIVWAKTAPP